MTWPLKLSSMALAGRDFAFGPEVKRTCLCPIRPIRPICPIPQPIVRQSLTQAMAFTIQNSLFKIRRFGSKTALPGKLFSLL
jgi:hypothetical protein